MRSLLTDEIKRGLLRYLLKDTVCSGNKDAYGGKKEESKEKLQKQSLLSLYFFSLSTILKATQYWIKNRDIVFEKAWGALRATAHPPFLHHHHQLTFRYYFLLQFLYTYRFMVHTLSFWIFSELRSRSVLLWWPRDSYITYNVRTCIIYLCFCSLCNWNNCIEHKLHRFCYLWATVSFSRWRSAINQANTEE